MVPLKCPLKYTQASAYIEDCSYKVSWVCSQAEEQNPNSVGFINFICCACWLYIFWCSIMFLSSSSLGFALILPSWPASVPRYLKCSLGENCRAWLTSLSYGQIAIAFLLISNALVLLIQTRNLKTRYRC